MHSACTRELVEGLYIKFDEDWSNDSSLMVVVCRLVAGVIEEAVDEGLEAPMSGVVDWKTLYSYSS